MPLTRPLATGLVYAIRSETQDFGREAAGPDHAAYDRCSRASTARAGAHPDRPLPLAYFRNLRRALDGLLGVGSLVVSHLGRVDQPDIVPEIADLLLRMEGKTWSLATGSHGDRLYLSIRTTNSRADAGNLMRRLIGRRGKGGGHGTMAGGYVMLPKNSGDPVKTLERRSARSSPRRCARIPIACSPSRSPCPKAPSPSRAPRHDRRPREVSAGPRATGGAHRPDAPEAPSPAGKTRGKRASTSKTASTRSASKKPGKSRDGSVKKTKAKAKSKDIPLKGKTPKTKAAVGAGRPRRRRKVESESAIEQPHAPAEGLDAHRRRRGRQPGATDSTESLSQRAAEAEAERSPKPELGSLQRKSFRKEPFGLPDFDAAARRFRGAGGAMSREEILIEFEQRPLLEPPYPVHVPRPSGAGPAAPARRRPPRSPALGARTRHLAARRGLARRGDRTLLPAAVRRLSPARRARPQELRHRLGDADPGGRLRRPPHRSARRALPRRAHQGGVGETAAPPAGALVARRVRAAARAVGVVRSRPRGRAWPRSPSAAPSSCRPRPGRTSTCRSRTLRS
jgi:hypothetical protein